jgi:PAS domain S-box-containing protein
MSERLYDYIIPVNQEFMFMDEGLTKKELIRGVYFRRIFANYLDAVRYDNELRQQTIHYYKEKNKNSSECPLDQWLYMHFDNGDNLLVKSLVEEIEHSDYSLMVRHQIMSYSMGSEQFETAVMSGPEGKRLKHNEYLLAVWEPSKNRFTYSTHTREYLENWSSRTVIDDSFLGLLPKELLTDIMSHSETLTSMFFPVEIAGLESTDQFNLCCTKAITNLPHAVYVLMLQRTQHRKHSIHFNGEFYKTILNSATVDLCVFDTSHRYLFINKNAVKNDETREWLIGKTDFDYCAHKGLDTKMAQTRRELFRKALDTMETVAMEEKQTSQNGDTKYSLKYFKPVVDGPMVKYVIGFGLDITKQKEIEYHLRESESKYRDLFERSLDLIQSIDKEGNLIFINQAWSKKTGYTSEDLAKSSVFVLLNPKEKEHGEQLFSRALKGETMMDIQVVYLTKSGERLELEGNIVPRVEQGEVVAVHAFFRDVTERNYKEELLRQSLAEKESLLGEIHHRVKNNLTVVYSLLELQAMKEQDEKVKHVFKESQARIRSMALVHEKLYQSETFSRVDLTTYLKELIEYILRINQNASKPVEVVFKGEDIFVDINQAVPCGLLANEIFTNSCKYAFSETNDPTITISTSREEGVNLLTIRDNGKGLQEDFDPLALNTLGFKLIRTFVNQLKGSITHRNENGLIYTIKIPIK